MANEDGSGLMATRLINSQYSLPQSRWPGGVLEKTFKDFVLPAGFMGLQVSLTM